MLCLLHLNFIAISSVLRIETWIPRHIHSDTLNCGRNGLQQKIFSFRIYDCFWHHWTVTHNQVDRWEEGNRTYGKVSMLYNIITKYSIFRLPILFSCHFVLVVMIKKIEYYNWKCMRWQDMEGMSIKKF